LVTGVSRRPEPTDGIVTRPVTELREVLATTDILVSVLPADRKREA
jgi:phosphoglycerate dehydrogenase-like enzyme